MFSGLRGRKGARGAGRHSTNPNSRLSTSPHRGGWVMDAKTEARPLYRHRCFQSTDRPTCPDRGPCDPQPTSNGLHSKISLWSAEDGFRCSTDDRQRNLTMRTNMRLSHLADECVQHWKPPSPSRCIAFYDLVRVPRFASPGDRPGHLGSAMMKDIAALIDAAPTVQPEAANCVATCNWGPA